MSLILEKFIRQILENKGNYLFHGSVHKIKKFVLDYVNFDANNQFGPGIYFSNNLEDAKSYAYPEGYVYKVDLLNSSNLVPKNSEIDRRKVQQLLKLSPNLKDILTDWDEDPKVAYQMLLDSILNQDDFVEALQTIWFDVFKRQEKLFCEACIKVGVDGVIVPVKNSSFYILYNPEIVSVISAKKIKNST